MGRIVAGGRAVAGALLCIALSACNFDESSSTFGAVHVPPTSNHSPRPPRTDPPPASNPKPEQPNPDDEGSNAVPQINGQPSLEVQVGNRYSFVPTATDSNGDALSFTVTGKPAWASFDAATGRLEGVPGAGDAGSYDDITISVSDGQSTANLARFAINVVQQSNGRVTLNWQAPTRNTDGSALRNLRGYKIHYGKQAGEYSTTVSIDNAGITRYLIEDLAPGTYYFAITAVSATGAESDFSGEAKTRI